MANSIRLHFVWSRFSIIFTTIVIKLLMLSISSFEIRTKCGNGHFTSFTSSFLGHLHYVFCVGIY